jgi:aspartate/methionine/tyrosine aminotransferase
MIDIKPFEIERYFAKYEFSARYLLSASDCEPLSLQELLAMATDETKNMWDSLMLGYTETQGHLLLRQEITKLYKLIQPEEVIVLTPEEGVFITMNILLEKGDHIIVTSPGYQSLHEIATSLGCEVTNWEPSAETWEFNVNFVPDNIKPNTKLLVINFPHNPTGSMLSTEQLDQLIEIAKHNGICIFSDETYRLLECDQSTRLPSVVDVYENSISLFGVSKSFGLAGLRIGWLTTRNSITKNSNA